MRRWRRAQRGEKDSWGWHQAPQKAALLPMRAIVLRATPPDLQAGGGRGSFWVSSHQVPGRTGLVCRGLILRGGGCEDTGEQAQPS